MKISRDSAITLSIFFVLVSTFYVIGYWLIFRTGKATPLMMSVGLATIVTCLIRKRDLSSLGWGWGSWKYQWMSYLLPLCICGIAYLVIWLSGVGGLYNTEFVTEQKQGYSLSHWNDMSIIVFHIVFTASISFIISLPSILGEEIGWRGLLVPELAKSMSFSAVALISGLIWSAWHWPLMINGLYGNSGTPFYYQLFFFTLFITSAGVIMAYLRYKTNSVWTAVLFHGSSNIFIQKVFTPLTIETSESAWYVDEFGAALGFTACIVAIYFWRKGAAEFSNKLP